MTQIGKHYSIDAKDVGKLLYKLKVRDPNHPTQKGFPFEQAITHGIAKVYEGRSGDTYYRYNIEPVQDEFEQLLSTLPVSTTTPKAPTDSSNRPINTQMSIETKLKSMLAALNLVLESGELEQLYRLKADIADIYALLPQKAS
jgi:hypothetical protein